MGLYKSVPRIFEAVRYDDPELIELLAVMLPPSVTALVRDDGVITIHAPGRTARTVGPNEPGQWISVGTDGAVITKSDFAMETEATEA